MRPAPGTPYGTSDGPAPVRHTAYALSRLLDRMAVASLTVWPPGTPDSMKTEFNHCRWTYQPATAPEWPCGHVRHSGQLWCVTCATPWQRWRTLVEQRFLAEHDARRFSEDGLACTVSIGPVKAVFYGLGREHAYYDQLQKPSREAA